MDVSNVSKNDRDFLEQIAKDVMIIKYESHIQTIAVVLAFIGIVSIQQIFSKSK